MARIENVDGAILVSEATSQPIAMGDDTGLLIRNARTNRSYYVFLSQDELRSLTSMFVHSQAEKLRK